MQEGGGFCETPPICFFGCVCGFDMVTVRRSLML